MFEGVRADVRRVFRHAHGDEIQRRRNSFDAVVDLGIPSSSGSQQRAFIGVPVPDRAISAFPGPSTGWIACFKCSRTFMNQ